MNLTGLSTGQAPPAQAPLLLFAMMPFFLGLSGLVFVWQGGDMLASRWTPALLGVTHFLVLGTITPVMCGSLLQLAPVLLDSPYPKAALLAKFIFIPLGVGTLAIGTGFILSYWWLLVAGALLLTVGLGFFLVVTFRVLHRATARSGLLNTLRMASISLLVTLVFGFTLALGRTGWLVLPITPYWVDAHLAWGLGGWVGLMIAGTGIQIIPLFHMCRGFPDWFIRLLPLMVAITLCLATIVLIVPETAGYGSWLLVMLLAIHLAFNIFALYCEQHRERSIRDAHLWLWQTAHLAMVAAMIAQLLLAKPVVTGVLLLGSVLAFLIGSLIKILPFLTWLDIQQQKISSGQQQVRLPRLKEILPGWLANLVALCFGVSVVLLLGATAWPLLARPAGIFVMASALLLSLALAGAFRIHSQYSARFNPG